jgi:hypothetical protein
MKTIKKLIYIVLSLLILLPSACKKDEDIGPGVASLVPFNAVVGEQQFFLNFKGDKYVPYANGLSIPFGVFTSFNSRLALKGGETPIGLFVPPDTTINSIPIYKNNYHFPIGSMHTLFYVGKKNDIQEILIKEQFSFPGEKNTSIRFINTSPTVNPVVFKILGPVDSLISNDLTFKQYSDFYKVPIQIGAPNYVVRCEDAVTNEVIAELPLNGTGDNGLITGNSWLRNHFTVALVGEQGAEFNFRQQLVLISHTIN